MEKIFNFFNACFVMVGFVLYISNKLDFEQFASSALILIAIMCFNNSQEIKKGE